MELTWGQRAALRAVSNKIAVHIDMRHGAKTGLGIGELDAPRDAVYALRSLASLGMVTDDEGWPERTFRITDYGLSIDAQPDSWWK